MSWLGSTVGAWVGGWLGGIGAPTPPVPRRGGGGGRRVEEEDRLVRCKALSEERPPETIAFAGAVCVASAYAKTYTVAKARACTIRTASARATAPLHKTRECHTSLRVNSVSYDPSLKSREHIAELETIIAYQYETKGRL